MENKKKEIINGCLGVDPKLSYTKNSLPVCELSVGQRKTKIRQHGEK
jgi:hypothetical protein